MARTGLLSACAGAPRDSLLGRSMGCVVSTTLKICGGYTSHHHLTNYKLVSANTSVKDHHTCPRAAIANPSYAPASVCRQYVVRLSYGTLLCRFLIKNDFLVASVCVHFMTIYIYCWVRAAQKNM